MNISFPAPGGRCSPTRCAVKQVTVRLHLDENPDRNLLFGESWAGAKTMARTKPDRLIPALSLVISLMALVVAGVSYWETRQQDRRMLSSSVDFSTSFDDREKVVGIAVLNSGPAPARVDAIRFYVDGRLVQDADAAAEAANLDPDSLTSIDLKGGTIGVGETVQLFSRTTKNKKDLQKFLNFADDHLAIFIRSCSLANECAEKCSADDNGRCRMKTGQRSDGPT